MPRVNDGGVELYWPNGAGKCAQCGGKVRGIYVGRPQEGARKAGAPVYCSSACRNAGDVRESLSDLPPIDCRVKCPVCGANSDSRRSVRVIDIRGDTHRWTGDKAPCDACMTKGGLHEVNPNAGHRSTWEVREEKTDYSAPVWAWLDADRTVITKA